MENNFSQMSDKLVSRYFLNKFEITFEQAISTFHISQRGDTDTTNDGFFFFFFQLERRISSCWKLGIRSKDYPSRKLLCAPLSIIKCTMRIVSSPNSQETVIAFRHNYLTIALDPHQTCAGDVRHPFKSLHRRQPQYRSIYRHFARFFKATANIPTATINIISKKMLRQSLFTYATGTRKNTNPRRFRISETSNVF